FQYLARLWDVTQTSDWVNLFTAGRFGYEETTVMSMFRQVTLEAPLTGFGFGSAPALDGGYLYFYYQGGIVALTIYLTMLVSFLTVAIRATMRGLKEGPLLVAFLSLVIGSDIGAPT